jgi:hypothetical protein
MACPFCYGSPECSVSPFPETANLAGHFLLCSFTIQRPSLGVTHDSERLTRAGQFQ